MEILRRQILLKRAKIKQVDVARELGVSCALISRVISGERKNPMIREHLAKLLGKNVSDLWPPIRKECHERK